MCKQYLLVFHSKLQFYSLNNLQTRARKPRKTKDITKAITKEIVEDNDSSADENKKPKPKIDKVNFYNVISLIEYLYSLITKYISVEGATEEG